MANHWEKKENWDLRERGGQKRSGSGESKLGGDGETTEKKQTQLEGKLQGREFFCGLKRKETFLY